MTPASSTPRGPGASDGPDPRSSSRPAAAGGSRQERLVTRRDLAGWVDGPPRTARGDYPGQSLGLARSGPASLAGWGRRFLALFIDWGISLLVAAAWFDDAAWASLACFALMQVVLLGTLGTTLGKRLAGLQVVRLGGAWAGPARALLRTVLLCLVVPPLILDGDGRGAHDRLAGTVQIRM